MQFSYLTTHITFILNNTLALQTEAGGENYVRLGSSGCSREEVSYGVGTECQVECGQAKRGGKLMTNPISFNHIPAQLFQTIPAELSDAVRLLFIHRHDSRGPFPPLCEPQ